MAKQNRRTRSQILWLGAIVVSLAIAALAAYRFWPMSAGARADADDPAQVALGRQVYDEACASCHGEKLEGQPDWRIRLENGRLPAPPHDASGHTWHHPDRQLFDMTKVGLRALSGLGDYETDMPAFQGTLSDDEIWAVLAYIKSTWPAEIRARRDNIAQRNQEN